MYHLCRCTAEPGITASERLKFGEDLKSLKLRLHPVNASRDFQTLVEAAASEPDVAKKADIGHRIWALRQSLPLTEHAAVFGPLDEAFSQASLSLWCALYVACFACVNMQLCA